MDIDSGRAPKGIKRFDKGHTKGGQPHVHFDNNAALNKDGTWKEGYYELNNSQIDYLRQNGWMFDQVL